MEIVFQKVSTNEKIKIILLDIIALAVVFLVPAFAHKFSFPLYLAEPLRIMLVLAILHTRKENAYLLALSLPLVSYLISGHPVFFKMLIIEVELIFNVWLFIDLLKRFNSLFLPMFVSIIVSKVVYYIIQFLFLHYGLLTIGEIEHALLPQIIMIVIFSIYSYIILRKKSIK